MAKAGRPRGINNKEIICSVRMDEATKERLDAYCEKMGLVRSEAIRRAVDMLASEEDK